MDVQALQLAARFSLPPNSLGYCGRNTAPEKFKNCIINGNCDGVEEEITKFIVLHPYLKTISRITNRPLLDYQVVECFWLGNDLIKSFTPEHYNLLLDNFLSQGVPDWFVEELRLKVPKAFYPFHLFQVLHVGVGKASGAVPFNLESINNCMIRWGKVEELKDDQITVNLNSVLKNERYELTQTRETLTVNLQILPGLKVADTVAVHWKQVVKILTTQEEASLSFWSNEVCTHV